MVSEYFRFENEEIKGLTITILVLSFIMSFREWGTDKFDVGTGLTNLFNTIVIVTIAIIVREFAQRIFALRHGYRYEYRMWMYGLIIGLVLVFASYGWLTFIAPGGLVLHQITRARIGKFRHGLSYMNILQVSLAGPVANIILAMVFKMFMFLPNTALIEKAITINILIAVFALLPIPPLNGANVFFQSRLIYVFSYASIIGTGILVYFANVLLAIVGGLLLGGLMWLVYYLKVESA
ncbi:hypothetical protein D6745_05065 [Candidatus Woesearchaeota archaeon]|nr:MAG: hypothetical protein D6745_05065 [Candidatus Woesearchaeota archaeon]